MNWDSLKTSAIILHRQGLDFLSALCKLAVLDLAPFLMHPSNSHLNPKRLTAVFILEFVENRRSKILMRFLGVFLGVFISSSSYIKPAEIQLILTAICH